MEVIIVYLENEYGLGNFVVSWNQREKLWSYLKRTKFVYKRIISKNGMLKVEEKQGLSNGKKMDARN